MEPYPGLIGIKNGYTSKAGNTLVAAARHDDRTLVVTVMNPQSGARNAVYEEARELLDWGFKAGDRAVPVDSLPQAPEDDPSPAGPFDSLQQSGEPEQSDEAEPTDEPRRPMSQDSLTKRTRPMRRTRPTPRHPEAHRFPGHRPARAVTRVLP